VGRGEGGSGVRGLGRDSGGVGVGRGRGGWWGREGAGGKWEGVGRKKGGKRAERRGSEREGEVG